MLRSLKTLLLAAAACALPCTASRAFDLSINFAPPPIPVYEQPLCPADGYLWTPGYWAYEDEGYYWVPGVWVEPPRLGFLWTPGYWGFGDGLYVFHSGYWGPRVGFYGGVNYGGGYYGYGYGGGRWAGDRFLYNTAVTRVDTTVVRHTYVNREVLRERRTDSRASFNGRGGVEARPTTEQRQAAEGSRLRPTEAQLAHRQEAAHDRGQFASVNGGRPAKPAAERPGRGSDEGRAERPMARAEDPNRGEGGFQRPGRGGEDRAQDFRRRDRTDRVERQANGADGLTREEQRLARNRGSFGEGDAGRLERRAMRAPQTRQPQVPRGGEERRAAVGERRARQVQGQGQGRGEQRERRRQEGDGQAR